MKWSGVQGKTYKKGMWLNDQEWRDQVICQMIYLRNAIYFVGFVIAVTQSGPWLKIIGLNDDGIFAVYAFIVVIATSAFLRAQSKANNIEKRSMSTLYEDEYDED